MRWALASLALVYCQVINDAVLRAVKWVDGTHALTYGADTSDLEVEMMRG